MDEKMKISRRALLKGAGAASVTWMTARSGAAAGQAQAPSHPVPTAVRSPLLSFFTDDEARFVGAAVERLIPGDEKWGGAEAAGVLYYIDRQLASAWGAGARMYLEGPWDPDAPPEQGYQLRYSPAQLYRVALSEIREAVAKQHKGAAFWELEPAAMDEFLAALESGRVPLPSLPSTVFFETLLANTVEGFFSDPVYGGNREMVGWRMVGFPGAFAQYLALVDEHGFEFKRAPIGISNAEEVLGKEHHR